jgi:hypothetical protein
VIACEAINNDWQKHNNHPNHSKSTGHNPRAVVNGGHVTQLEKEIPVHNASFKYQISRGISQFCDFHGIFYL